MDKRNTRGRSHYGIIILLLLASFTTFGQCDNDSISIVKVDSCQMVQMSPKKFTEFYLYKKNLEEIKKELPGVEQTLDSLRKSHKLIAESLEAEIDSTNHQKSVVLQSLDECSQMLAEVDIENERLNIQVGELKKRQWKMFGAGAGICTVTIFLLKTLVK